MSDIISISDVIQIAILYAGIYAILKRARGSRFGQALMGVGIIAALLFACTVVFEFDVLAAIVRLVLMYLALSTVVIFQPEIRRMLSAVGAFGSFERAKRDADGAATPECVIETVLHLASLRMGALLAFERGISLRGYEEEGVALNADFSRELVRAVFTPPLPLHDGGMVIRRGRIGAAHCIFPVSNNPKLIASGMRHRAAVGLSEETDALVVVVSEETGAVSVAHNGKLYRYQGDHRETALKRWIAKAMYRGNRRTSVLDALWRRLKPAETKGEGESEEVKVKVNR